MPDFQGSNSIYLQTGDVHVPYQFTWTICTSSTGNDGALPFGHTVQAVSTTITHESGVDGTTGILSSSSQTGQITTIWLSFPTSSGILSGRYHIKFTGTIFDGVVPYGKTLRFNRLLVMDKG